MISPPFGFEFEYKVNEVCKPLVVIGESMKDSPHSKLQDNCKLFAKKCKSRSENVDVVHDDSAFPLKDGQCMYCWVIIPGKRLIYHEKYCSKALKTCVKCNDQYHIKEEIDHLDVCEDVNIVKSMTSKVDDSSNEDNEIRIQRIKDSIALCTKTLDKSIGNVNESRDEACNADSLNENRIVEENQLELSPSHKSAKSCSERYNFVSVKVLKDLDVENECDQNQSNLLGNENLNSCEILSPVINSKPDSNAMSDQISTSSTHLEEKTPCTNLNLCEEFPIVNLANDNECSLNTGVNNDSNTNLNYDLNIASDNLYNHDKDCSLIDNSAVNIDLKSDNNTLNLNWKLIKRRNQDSTVNRKHRHQKRPRYPQYSKIPVVNLVSDDEDDLECLNENIITAADSGHECSSNIHCVLTELSGNNENADRGKSRSRSCSLNSIWSVRSSRKRDDLLGKRKSSSRKNSVSDLSTSKTNDNSRKRRRYSFNSNSRDYSCYSNYLLDRFKNKEFSDQKSYQEHSNFEKPIIEAAFGDYYCQICGVSVSSDITLKTHLVGKKHQKVLRNMSVPEVARHSLSSSSQMSNFLPPEEKLHYPTPAPGMRRIRLRKRATIQGVADSVRKHSLAGLSYVTEIHLPQEMIFYCKLCDSTCAASSIMLHLIGFKHKLNYVKKKYPERYEKFYCKDKKVIKQEIERLVYQRDRNGSRGLIRVEKDIPLLPNDKEKPRSTDNNSERRLSFLHSEGGSDVQNRAETVKKDDSEIVMADLYCKICDTYMSSYQVWESHMKGRRHHKNAKKLPGEQPSKRKTYGCPGETAHLMNDLKYYSEPIVGLDYIQETQGRSGDQYKCLICSGCFTTYDIFEHLTSEKHRKKYLETMYKKGFENGIGDIKALGSLPTESRQHLIAFECEKMQNKYGSGKIKVYKTKDIYSDLYGPDHQRDIF